MVLFGEFYSSGVCKIVAVGWLSAVVFFEVYIEFCKVEENKGFLW